MGARLPRAPAPAQNVPEGVPTVPYGRQPTLLQRARCGIGNRGSKDRGRRELYQIEGFSNLCGDGTNLPHLTYTYCTDPILPIAWLLTGSVMQAWCAAPYPALSASCAYGPCQTVSRLALCAYSAVSVSSSSRYLLPV